MPIMLKVFLIMVLFWISCSVSAAEEHPEINVTPKVALLDQPVKIIISHLLPNQKITLHASLTDQNNNIWASFAVFKADNKGTVNVATEVPVAGSYKSADPMGLFWSMLPINKKTTHYFINGQAQSIVLTVTLENNPKILAQNTLHRILLADNIERKSINENGIIGTLFYPKNSKNLPGIVTLSGSGGGIDEETSALLASHGYAVLALGYFGADGLPKTLEKINLEYFQKSMQWFKQQPQVKSDKVAVMGDSRGGELALLIAAMFPREVNAVIAYVPSNVVYGGIPFTNRPAWYLHNKPITPFMGGLTSNDPNLMVNDDLMNATKQGKIPFHKNTYDDPYDLSALFIAINNKNPTKFKKSEIPVEKIQCPIIIFAGADDKLWPSSYYSHLVMNRLNKKGSTIEKSFIPFANTGHEFLLPDLPAANLPYYHPVAKMWLSYGGTMEANARASEVSWLRTLNFLNKTFNR